jgi:hypothetical protein
MLQMKYERRTCDAVVSDLQPVHYILLGIHPKSFTSGRHLQQ